MRVFITGGTGFIGRRVVALLKKRKHTVHCMNARLHELEKIEKELKRFKPAVVMHLAWEGLPDYGVAASAKNFTQGVQFFTLLAKLKIHKVVSAGSCFEHDDETSSHFAYTVAKRALREMGTALFKENGGVFVWAVLFFVYGVGKPPQSLFPTLMVQAKRGETPTVKTDVHLDYVYVDDVARALVLLAEKHTAAGVYEVGMGKLTRTGEIARAVAREYGLSPVPLSPKRKTGRAAHTRALHALGWKPKFSIRKGIQAMRGELSR